MRDLDPVQERVVEFIQREGLCTTDDRLLVAVSGGVDSSVLAHLLHTAGFEIALAHCNYGLRGADSEADADLVRRMGETYRCPVFVKDEPLPQPVPDSFNLQTWARKKRYIHFEKILDEYYYTRIVTAHHLDDNLETLLMNVVRGTGIRGFAGIPPQREPRVIRPLLEESKTTLLAYASRHGLTWRYDVSNSRDDYLRNRLRHHVAPHLRSEGLGDGSLAATFRYLRSALRTVEASWRDHSSVLRSPASVRFDRATLPAHPDDAFSVVHATARSLGFSSDQVRQMLTAHRPLEVRASVWQARVTDEAITLLPRSTESSVAHTVDALPARLPWYGSIIVLEEMNAADDPRPGTVEMCRMPRLPLHLRSRAPGDTFAPLGMEGKRKKLKSFLIDQKIPKWDRPAVAVLTDREDEVVCLVGLRLAHPFARRGDEKVLLRIGLETTSPDTKNRTGA